MRRRAAVAIWRSRVVTSSRPRILVLGLIGCGRENLSAAQIERVLCADLLVGGDRQLACFPDACGERLSLRQGLMLAVERLRQVLDAGQRAVVLASGDPLCYGIGASLRRWFSADELELVPAPSAYQLAFAALAEPWHDAALLSAHGRPLAEVISAVQRSAKAAILTDDSATPPVIARALLAAGLPATTPCAICEHLAEPEQRIVRTTLGEAAEQTFAALNVMVVWRGEEALVAHPRPYPPGLPDERFSTTGGLITKRELRLLILAELALQPNEVLWDLGAGSGSVGIEAARWQPAAMVYAVERRAELCAHIRENLRRFPAPNLRLIEGTAPEVCAALPDPQAVFIGGSAGQLTALLALGRQRLGPGGCLVLSVVTLEHLEEARALLPEARVIQIQINVGKSILGKLRLEAQNPLFLLTWRNEDEPNPSPDGHRPGAG